MNRGKYNGKKVDVLDFIVIVHICIHEAQPHTLSSQN